MVDGFACGWQIAFSGSGCPVYGKVGVCHFGSSNRKPSLPGIGKDSACTGHGRAEHAMAGRAHAANSGADQAHEHGQPTLGCSTYPRRTPETRHPSFRKHGRQVYASATHALLANLGTYRSSAVPGSPDHGFMVENGMFTTIDFPGRTRPFPRRSTTKERSSASTYSLMAAPTDFRLIRESFGHLMIRPTRRKMRHLA
jgi:hypothetical protein